MTRTVPVVQGGVAPGYEDVAQAFIDNFIDARELGGACTVYCGGRAVVDIWGGAADARHTRPWSRDTTVPVFSATKGALNTCVHLLIQRGELDPDTAVADYWPEFAARGKHDISLRWLMSHQAGIPAIDAAVTMAEIAGWDGAARAVAQQQPAWTPGTAHGYHPRSIGWVLGEVVRRVTGRTIGAFFADEIAGPLGLEWWIGTPRDVQLRTATINPPPPEDVEEATGLNPLRERALDGPSGLFAYDGRWNDPRYLDPEIPSSNGVATARALARLYGSLIGDVDGIRVLSASTLRAATEVQVDGYDLILMRRSTFGLGFSIAPGLGAPFREGAFGHPGAGGSLGFADPTVGFGFGYVTNQLRLGAEETARADRLVSATYRAIDRMAS